jgi:hypothetical protein
MALELNTYGDLKKAIKTISLKQKGQQIVSQGKSFALYQILGLIPGASNAKTTFDFIKAAISKPDTKKTSTWLDKLDIDDQMSKIVDDTVENGFMQAMAASIDQESDETPLEPGFNMNAKMTDYLKKQYSGRTVAGIKENMDIKEYIKSLVRELLDEESTSGDAGGYLTPMAFAKKGQKTNAATKQAERSGWKKVEGMPKNSKVLDYKELWPGKHSAMNEEEQKFKVGDKVKYENQEWKIEKILDNGLYRLKNLKGLPSTNVSPNKVTAMNESLLDIIEQELLNEVTYSKFKNDVKFRTKNEQLHKAIREVKRKLMEIDRIVEYTSRMKQELSEGEEGVKYWKATQKNVATISEMVNQLNNKIKNLQQ